MNTEIFTGLLTSIFQSLFKGGQYRWILTRVLDSLQRVIDVNRLWLQLVEDDQEHLKVISERNLLSKELDRLNTITLDTIIEGQTLESRVETSYFLQASSLFGLKDNPPLTGSESPILIIPLKSPQLIGIFCVQLPDALLEDVEWKNFLTLIGRIITLYLLKTKERGEVSQPRVESSLTDHLEDILASQSEISEIEVVRSPSSEFTAALADFEKLAALAESYGQRVKDNLHQAVIESRRSSQKVSADKPDTTTNVSVFSAVDENPKDFIEASGRQSGNDHTFTTHNMAMKRFRDAHQKNSLN